VQRYSLIARMFVMNGYDVVGFDYKGFGRSEGQRGYIGDNEKFYEDGLNFLDQVRGYYAAKLRQSGPLIAFGFSVGCTVIAAVSIIKARRKEPGFDAVVMNAPNFKL